MLVLKNIAQVVTLGVGPVPRCGTEMEELGIIPDGAVLIRGQRIAWVGPSSDLPLHQYGSNAGTIDGTGLELVALPGFVDSHTHPIFAGSRVDEYEMRCRGKSYQEISAAGGGIRASVRQLRQTSFGQLVRHGEKVFRQFLRHGTTTIEAKSGYGLSMEDELKILRVIERLRSRSRLEVVPTFLGAHAVPDEFRDSRHVYVEKLVKEMIPRVAREGLARFCDVFCDTGYFTVEEARTILTAARDHGLGLRIHAEELRHGGGARLAAEFGARSADHLEWVDDGDIAALRRAGTVATLLPGTAFNLGLTRYPPARALIEARVPVALATDFNPGSCFTPNLQLILSIACSQMSMTPAEAVTAATINGAYSLGLAERLGSIERGKQADIVLMSIPDYREIPYRLGVNHCVVAIKRGRVVLNLLERP
ncbi:MAG: imidazolonepropionase [Acidobacteria bacterium]|nr:imidazolonepropionase [Acidobacteriota bacterium]